MRRVPFTIGVVMLAVLTTMTLFAQPIAVTAQSPSVTGSDYRQFPELITDSFVADER